MLRRVALLTLAIAIVSGCNRDKTGIDLPRYPGALYSPLPRREFGSYMLYGALLRTTMDARPLGQWYSEQLKEEGWDKQEGGQLGSTFWNNMEMPSDGQRIPRPKDPSVKGSYISVDAGGIVTMYQSIPKKTE
jgi:hypothetical protein